MASFGLELAGISLSVVGWLLSIVSCALPMWRVSAFIGANIVTAQVYWEGLWMTCVVQSTGQMQCKVYDSMLALPQDLQAARALTMVAIIAGMVALLLSMVAAKNMCNPENSNMLCIHLGACGRVCCGCSSCDQSANSPNGVKLED
uniref:Claudin n=1 Tax=Salarias fasciatus TaxID=181472 RepID=A0A672GMF2_SALFA